MKKTTILSGLLCLVLGLIAGCSTPLPKTTSPLLEVTDQLGRKVGLEAIPQRIISLAPSNTEILFALGLAERVVAVTNYCDYPAGAADKPSIGGFSTPNIEEIIALSPDLVLATSRHEDQIIPQLEDKGITVFALNPETLDDVLASIALTGRITGAKANAAELVGEIQQRINTVTDKTAGLPLEQRPSTFYVLWHDPLKTAGSGTLQDELIQKAGGTNIARETTGYANISLEVVVNENPAVIIAGTSHGSSDDQTYQFARTESRLNSSDAHQYDRVYAIDSDLTSRAGPRLVNALEEFASYIHPEIFK